MRKDYRVPQTLKISNGYRQYANVESCTAASVRYTDLLSQDSYMDAKFTYPVLHRPQPEPIVPQFVKYDKLCLCFPAIFIQTVAMYPEEMNQRRQVKVLYFLEDDTMCVLEGRQRMVRRGKYGPRPDCGSNYHWKDLNVGKEIVLNEIRFYLYDCDQFTREFLTSKGIVIDTGDMESYMASQLVTTGSADITPTASRNSVKMDKLRRFLDLHGQVLSFDCTMEKVDSFQKEPLTFKLYFFLEDETVTIKELKENQEGRHRFPLYLRRTKVPKSSDPSSAPNAYLEAKDLRIGEIINVFGTKFLLNDCDQYTRQYFDRHLRQPQQGIVETKMEVIKRLPRKDVPAYMGLGTPEDSLTSTMSLRPKAPVIGMPQCDAVLRYKCELADNPHREFILKFNVRHWTITITELPVDNSGIMQGLTVSSQRVVKPNCDPNLPQYYGPSDLLVGSVILVNCRRFRITGADKCVEEFSKKYPELYRN